MYPEGLLFCKEAPAGLERESRRLKGPAKRPGEKGRGRESQRAQNRVKLWAPEKNFPFQGVPDNSLGRMGEMR